MQDLTLDFDRYLIPRDSDAAHESPGSHREPLTMMSDQRRLRHEREDPVYLRSGEIILIHNNLVHTGTSPAPPVRERAFVSIFYNLSWLKQTQLFEGPCAMALKEKFRRTDWRLLRLLGEDTTLIQRNDTGFLDDEESQWSLWMKEDRLSRR